MSWISDIVEPISGFIDKNSSWLKPVVTAGVSVLKQSQADDTQSQYLDYLRQREQANYESYINNANAYNSQLGRSGGGGNNGAAAAAARANEAARQAAAKKANRKTQKTYKQILAMYEPYRKTADQLLPQMTQTYQNSLGLQNALAQYVSSPDQTAKLNGSIPAYNVNVPLPDSVRLK